MTDHDKTGDNERIVRISVDNPGVVRYQADMEREIEVAIYDLVDDNVFRPEAAFFGGSPTGPYDVTLRIQENRLLFDIEREGGGRVGAVTMALSPFRRTIRDYFIICDSYYDAIRTATPSQIEAIDMGRRALHDEGSEKLSGLLADKVALDHNTARRLFTLICALHVRI